MSPPQARRRTGPRAVEVVTGATTTRAFRALLHFFSFPAILPFILPLSVEFILFLQVPRRVCGRVPLWDVAKLHHVALLVRASSYENLETNVGLFLI